MINSLANLKNKNFASNKLWGKTLSLSFYLQAHYYGQAQEKINNVKLLEELNKFNIDYYFVWDISHEKYDYLSKFKEITEAKIEGLRIYEID